jgi:Spy/CpxP family protein refolding chaperone
MHQARKIQKKELRGSMNLKKFVSVDGFDKEGFMAASESRSKKMVKNRAEMMEKFITVLTPEQRIALVEKLNRQKKGKRHQAK